MDFVNNIQESNTNYNEPSVVLIYADWCPHCQVMEPEWDSATDEMGQNVKVIKIESNDLPEHQNMLHSHGAHSNGYPTIYAFTPGNGPEYYGGERKKEGFISWVKKLFPSTKKKKSAAKKSGGYIKNQVQSSKTKTKKKKKGSKKFGGYIKDQVQTPSSKTKKKNKKNKKNKKKDE